MRGVVRNPLSVIREPADRTTTNGQRVFIMPKVKIELPAVDADDTVVVELTVNGEKSRMTYRIEILDWASTARPGEERALVLKRMIEEYEEGWRLIQIGRRRIARFL